MAWDINQVVLVGRLTRDPEYSVLKGNNTAICKFSIANSRGTQTPDAVSYFDIVAFGKTAELCNQYLRKGKQVIITGRLKQNRFQDQNGQNRSKVEITADNVQFLGGREEGGSPNHSEPNYSNSNNDFNNSNDSFDSMSSGGLFDNEFGNGNSVPF